jgi:hypothetical protein
MIVALSRYNTLKKENVELRKERDRYRRMYSAELQDCVRGMKEYNDLTDEYNVLVRKAKRLQQLCKESELYTNPFSKEFLNKLITLCHPNKHDGKRSATEITQKLLEMRGKV